MFNDLGGEISVPIPQDDEGYIGRECPTCQKYFKITLGTGLKGTNHAFCPYCGHKDESRAFTTTEQVEYAKSVAFRRVADQVHRSLKRSLEGRYPKQRSFINIEIEVKRGTPIPLAYYTEKDLETKIVCANCTLSYAVYGVFAFCPDCGQHNSLQILTANFTLVEKLLQMAQTVDKDVREVILESCLGKVVAAFDGYGREMCGLYAQKTANPIKAEKVSFQNLHGAQNHMQTHFGIDIASPLSPIEWQSTIKLFQKRHLFSHRAGEIDDEYIAKTNDPSAIKGHKISLQYQEITAIIDYAKRIAEYVDLQMRTLFGSLT